VSHLASRFRVATVLICALLAAETLSGCVSTSPFITGIVTGTAHPCVGVGVGTGVPVQVNLTKNFRLIKSEIVRYPHQFLISAPPDRYDLSSTAGTSRFRIIRIQAGTTLHINFPTACTSASTSTTPAVIHGLLLSYAKSNAAGYGGDIAYGTPMKFETMSVGVPNPDPVTCLGDC
jgi:hypothetical protein